MDERYIQVTGRARRIGAEMPDARPADHRAFHSFADAFPNSKLPHKPDFKQCGRFYVESVIDAFGAMFLVIVSDHNFKPFWSCRYDMTTGACADVRRWATRTEAIKDASESAIARLTS